MSATTLATGERSDDPELHGPDTRDRPVRRRLLSVLVVLPYLLLGFAWVWTNPIGAAPDEPAHLIKALGVAQLDIGEQYVGPADDPQVGGSERNASITRLVTIPSVLVPAGTTCFATDSNATADCLPAPRGDAADATSLTATPVGAYPPFLYLPIGMAALAGDSVTQAVHYGRMAVLGACCLLLWVAASHLLRWLPADRAVLGLAWALTPMAVYSASILSLSGLEIAAAAGVAAVVVAGIARPESLSRPATHLTLAVSGCTLVLSRQLGLLTFGVFAIALLLGVGAPRLWALVRRPRASLVVCLASLATATGLVLWWELTFDHPSGLGPVAALDTWRSFLDRSGVVVESAVGSFGWLDTQMPPWSVSLWIGGLSALLGMGMVLGRRSTRSLIVGSLTVTAAVAYVVYSVVFSPLDALLQGRHMLPLFVLAPLLAGAGALAAMRVPERRRALALTAVLVPALHVVALVVNARRYAVGVDGPLAFLETARWAPPGGWWPWAVVTAVATVTYIAMLLVARVPRGLTEVSHVAR